MLLNTLVEDSSFFFQSSGTSSSQAKYGKEDCSPALELFTSLSLGNNGLASQFLVQKQHKCIPTLSRWSSKAETFQRRENQEKWEARAVLTLIFVYQLRVHRAPGFLAGGGWYNDYNLFQANPQFLTGLLRSITTCWREQWEPVTQLPVFMCWQDLLAGIRTFFLSTQSIQSNCLITRLS